MDFGVRIPELEVRVVVVELPNQPGIGVMTSGAILPQASFVDIVGAMAVDTDVAGITKNGGCMASFAT